MSAHSPTPWQIKRRVEFTISDIRGEKVAETYREWSSTRKDEFWARAAANAVLIVRCVNAHNELVAALQLVARTKSSDDRPEVQQAIDAARVVLARVAA